MMPKGPRKGIVCGTTNNCQLRVAGIVEDSITDGPGLRLAVFTQGCQHNCQDCHNPQTHAQDGGHLIDIGEILSIYKDNPLLSGITFSGGEPFLQAAPLAALGAEIHALGGDIVTYTGFYLEDLQKEPLASKIGVAELLSITDYLIDGPFVKELASMELLYRGSSNQHLLKKINNKFEIVAKL